MEISIIAIILIAWEELTKGIPNSRQRKIIQEQRDLKKHFDHLDNLYGCYTDKNGITQFKPHNNNK